MASAFCEYLLSFLCKLYTSSCGALVFRCARPASQLGRRLGPVGWFDCRTGLTEGGLGCWPFSASSSSSCVHCLRACGKLLRRLLLLRRPCLGSSSSAGLALDDRCELDLNCPSNVVPLGPTRLSNRPLLRGAYILAPGVGTYSRRRAASLIAFLRMSGSRLLAAFRQALLLGASSISGMGWEIPCLMCTASSPEDRPPTAAAACAATARSMRPEFVPEERAPTAAAACAATARSMRPEFVPEERGGTLVAGAGWQPALELRARAGAGGTPLLLRLPPVQASSLAMAIPLLGYQRRRLASRVRRGPAFPLSHAPLGLPNGSSEPCHAKNRTRLRELGELNRG